MFENIILLLPIWVDANGPIVGVTVGIIVDGEVVAQLGWDSAGIPFGGVGITVAGFITPITHCPVYNQKKIKLK